MIVPRLKGRNFALIEVFGLPCAVLVVYSTPEDQVFTAFVLRNDAVDLEIIEREMLFVEVAHVIDVL
jgi:hypothetical protein